MTLIEFSHPQDVSHVKERWRALCRPKNLYPHPVAARKNDELKSQLVPKKFEMLRIKLFP
jgi:hypothetical protein